MLDLVSDLRSFLFVDLTDEIVERKIDICHELLEVLDVLDPGCSKVRGTVLYELQAAMVVLTKREFNKGKLTKTSAQVMKLGIAKLGLTLRQGQKETSRSF